MKQLAQGIRNPVLGPTLQSIQGQPNSGITFVARLVQSLVTLFLIIGSLIFFFMLITGGIQWILSGGDKAALESARSRVTHAIIGLAILFSVFAVVGLIQSFFGISILSLDIMSLAL